MARWLCLFLVALLLLNLLVPVRAEDEDEDDDLEVDAEPARDYGQPGDGPRWAAAVRIPIVAPEGGVAVPPPPRFVVAFSAATTLLDKELSDIFPIFF